MGMEVLCACDDRYLPHTATMLRSLLEHNAVARIYLFYSSIKRRDLTKLSSFIEKHEIEILTYEISSVEFQALKVSKHVPYYRILAPHLLPMNVGKVLYLDSDLIVRYPLKELWDTDLADRALAAVIDGNTGRAAELGLPAGAKYFNSGVMLINLDFWRRYDIESKVIDFIKHNPNRLEHWDQDALNAVLAGSWTELNARWNVQYEAIIKGPPIYDAAVAHFCGDVKPWHWSKDYTFRNEYRVYRQKTPWPRYRLELRPGWPKRLQLSLRGLARDALPGGLRQWLRSMR
jgi:lipopolysaccharide biosynthesis glycosyltransferase